VPRPAPREVECPALGRRTPIPRAAAACATATLFAAGCAARRPAGAGDAQITPQALAARVSILAHDSMAGRAAGTPANVAATEYVAAEFRRLGLLPAGDGGTYFQAVPLVRQAFGAASRLAAGDSAIGIGPDFLTDPGMAAGRTVRARAILAGYVTDSASWATADRVAGHVAVLTFPPGHSELLPLGPIFAARRFASAAALVVAAAHLLPPEAVRAELAPRPGLPVARSPEGAGAPAGAPAGAAAVPVPALVSERAARLLFDAPLAQLRPGALGREVEIRVTVDETPVPAPARNVVAVLPGRDPALRGQYVALGAHNDHDPPAAQGVDHDSLRAYHAALVAAGASDPFDPTFPPERRAAIRVNVDSLRRLRPARRDSVLNGADDNASGTAALIGAAETLARGATRPRRSVLFVSHTAEELGLLGARWFTDHPTVPRDSIVAHLNMDMVGRSDGGPAGLRGETYLMLIGARRISAEFGDTIAAVNRAQPRPFALDLSFDAPAHPLQLYCRSDHAMYARFGIPVAALSTGIHPDYHQVTDEPQYLDYDKLARVTRLVADAARRLAEMPRRLVLDAPKPDPDAPCTQ
jgi:hypothetical protein